MDTTRLTLLLEEGLAEIPLLNIHTHLDAAHLTARGLHDILLYHMIVSDRSSAGCPSRSRLSEECDRVMADRLDMVAANRQVGFFRDAYCREWTYAKAIIIHKQMAEVLAHMVAQGQCTVDDALSIARQILFETPHTLNGMQPGAF